MTIINIQALQAEKLKRLKQIKKDIINGNYSIVEEQENFKKLMNKTIDYHKKCIKENGRMEIF